MSDRLNQKVHKTQQQTANLSLIRDPRLFSVDISQEGEEESKTFRKWVKGIETTIPHTCWVVIRTLDYSACACCAGFKGCHGDKQSSLPASLSMILLISRSLGTKLLKI